MRLIVRTGTLLALSGAAATVLAASALGAAVPGATYGGTFAEERGTLSFTVSADGKSVTSVFKAGDRVIGPSCTNVFSRPTVFDPPFSIFNDSFYGSYSGKLSTSVIKFGGKFTGAQTAEGEFRMYDDLAGYFTCDTDVINWSAATTALPPSSPSTPGPTDTGKAGAKAVVAGVAPSKGGRALLRMRCPGSAKCSGVAKLWFKASARRGRAAGGPSPLARRSRKVLVAKTGFAIPAGKSRKVYTKLTGKGKRLLRRSRRHRLRVQLNGRGVKARTVLLKQTEF